MHWLLTPIALKTLATVTLCGMVLGACSSIEGNKLVNRSDGSVSKHDVGGLPITVKVPKKAIFVITKTVYSVVEQRTEFDAATGMTAIVTTPARHLAEVTFDKEPIILGPTETYSIDPRRPLYGTIDYEIDLAEQYPTKFKGKVDDKTLEQVRAMVENLAGKFAGAPPVEKQAGVAEQLIKTPVSQTVTLLIFDLEAGTYETQTF